MKNEKDRPTIEYNIIVNVGSLIFDLYIDIAFFKHINTYHVENHKHSTFEFHILEKGSGLVCIDNIQYEVSAGSYYIIRAGTYHMHKGITKDLFQKIAFKFELNIDNNNKYRGYYEKEIKAFNDLMSNVKFFHSKNYQKIKTLVDEIHFEFTHKEFGYYTKIQYLFALLFTEVIREIAEQDKQRFKTVDIPNFQEKRNIIIDNFFITNIYYKATVQDLCDLVYISKSQLNRLMKERYRMSYKQKFIESQIEHIKDLLVNTELSIGAISEKMGYTSECNFITFFKRWTGLTPRVYRKSMNPK